MWHGILIVNKERGLTSHQVIAKLRRILRQKEIGHTGTLDPEAEGVLVVGLGQATRSFSFLDESVKTYRAEVILGRRTETQDASGRIITEHLETNVSLEILKQAIKELTGDIRQIPPMYSAVKINGQKLYDLARQGVTVERGARPITVYSWVIEGPKSNYGFKESFVSVISCSKGTYIRTLIDDLGERLGCGAHMGSLLRLQSGIFQLEQGVTLDQLNDLVQEGRLNERIISITEALRHLPSLYLEQEDLFKVNNGGKLSFYKYDKIVPTNGLVKALETGSDQTIAILKLMDNGSYQFWQPVKVFRYD
jgi:tRNA pseudouridine55 synthase